jgi:unsaturated rhamnogalacturonyl hydrolase
MSSSSKRAIQMACLAAVILLIPNGLLEQLTPAEKAWVGDTPATPPPLATNLSPELTQKNISHAIEKVADWELTQAEPHFDQDWTFAALYTGFMAVPMAANGEKYQKAMVQMSQKFNWQPGPRVGVADDMAIGQTYLSLYFLHHDPAMIAPIRQRGDAMMALPNNPDKLLWWWCDALFMAPPVFTKLSQATGDRKYLDFMDQQWWITSNLLYSPSNHLFFRDKTFLDKHEANSSSVFWSRGNGWVFAGLAKVLAEMPQNYPSRAKYVTQFREMAEEIAGLQSTDGLWRPGLLDAAAYPLPENSGSAFFTYGFAYGINSGILERAKYQPVVQKAWKGLLSHIYQDGRLGCIQPIGAAPGDYSADSNYVFGTGAFLLAGSEVYRLAR